jgi:hypothetical protein
LTGPKANAGEPVTTLVPSMSEIVEGHQGQAVDKRGNPVIDPTRNVIDLVRAADKRSDDLVALNVRRIDDLREANQHRQDDLRVMADTQLHELVRVRAEYDKQLREEERQQQRRREDMRGQESAHVRELLAQQANYEEKLRQAETHRIDNVRAVDVAAVAEAARVSAAQALTLANQVATTAGTNRTQVVAVAAATALALGNAMEPIIRQLAELSQKQYELQGQKQAQVESKGDFQSGRTAIISLIGIAISFIGLAIVFAAYIATHK